MALDIRTLTTRIVSALIFGILFLWLLWEGEGTFVLLFSIIHIGCWIEYQRITERIYPLYKSSQLYYITLISLGNGIILYATGENFHIGILALGFLGSVIVLISLFLLPILGIIWYTKGLARRSYLSLLGFLYISLPCLAIVYVRLQHPFSFPPDQQKILLTTLIISVWLNDSFAYLVGSLMGRMPFFAHISPKKTWEGALGGLLVSVVTIAILSYNYYPHLMVLLIGTACFSSLAGIVGDLIESLLKRRAGIKDSGKILPGHGGFLDRFDALLFAIPATLLWVTLYFWIKK